MAAPSWAASGTEHSGTSATPAFGVPAGMILNQVAVAVFFVNGATDQNATPPDETWVLAEGCPVASSNHKLYVYLHRAAGNEAGSYTFTLDNAVFVEGQAHRYTDCVTTGALLDAGTDTAVDDTDGLVTPAVDITTLGADRRLLHAATNWAGGTWTPNAGFTKRQQNSVGLATLSDAAQAVAGLSGSIAATSTNANKRTAWLGALKTAAQTVTGTATGSLGALSGTATGRRTVLGAAAGVLGRLVGHATALDTSAGTGGGWGSLLAVNQEARLIAAEEAVRRPVACPNDGEPLVTGPNGELFCPFDGWRG